MIDEQLAQVLRDRLEMQIAGENGDEDLASEFEQRADKGEETLLPEEDAVAQMFYGDVADAFRLLHGASTLDFLMNQTRADRVARESEWLRSVVEAHRPASEGKT